VDEAVLAERWPATVSVDPTDVDRAVTRSATVLVVLDDDPTGTQSVAGLPVLTSWERDDLRWALEQRTPAFYVLTNTRSLDAVEAAERNREIVRIALEAAAELGIRVAFVSRGDSTLRGHYPLETDVIAATLVESGERAPDGVIIVPAFPDAGRVTIGGVHYHRTADGFTPVGETEFARDATFGFRSSRLDEWVEEKTEGRIVAADVVSLELDVIRRGPDAIAEVLRTVSDSTPVVVDVVVEDDMRLLSLALAQVESEGRTFLYRVGPPFVRARIGQEVAAPLTAAELPAVTGTDRGGLIVVGSHVALTTRQLEALRADRPDAAGIEIEVARIADAEGRDQHVADVAGRVSREIARGADAIIQTSRDLVTADDPAKSLDFSRQVSAAVVEVVQRVLADTPPRFVIAKGGITSSDVAAFGLGIRHAIVRGPMLPGIVSLWEPQDGPAEGIPFVVFAGNVGDDDSLAAVVGTFAAARTGLAGHSSTASSTSTATSSGETS